MKISTISESIKEVLIFMRSIMMKMFIVFADNFDTSLVAL